MSKITRRGFFQQAGVVTAAGATFPELLSTSLQAETEASWKTRPDWLALTKELEWSPFRSQCFRSFIVERSLDSSVVVCGDFMLLGFAVIRRSTTVFDTSGADVSAGGCSSPSIHRCAPLARGWFRSSRALSSHTSGFARVVR